MRSRSRSSTPAEAARVPAPARRKETRRRSAPRIGERSTRVSVRVAGEWRNPHRTSPAAARLHRIASRAPGGWGVGGGEWEFEKSSHQTPTPDSLHPTPSPSQRQIFYVNLVQQIFRLA